MIETMHQEEPIDTAWLPDPDSEDGKPVSEADYWYDYYDHHYFRYEWNDGFLEEKPPTNYDNDLTHTWLYGLIDEYLAITPIAIMIMLRIGFRLDLGDKINIRIPHIGMILNNNPIPIRGPDQAYKGIYDLCTECYASPIAPRNKQKIKEKLDDYAKAGVSECYILTDQIQHAAFYQLSQAGLYIPMPAPDGVIRSNVLPGFQFRIADLYSRPNLKELTEDHIYKNFVMLDYQQQRERAEIAEIQTEQERERAEIAEKQAKQYAAMLREAGILPDKEESHD
ncbi:Uma2 family endonuclease [Anaerolineales bacterium HSG24]|nr:Uma2 family endonuclease [Anaerolineales bacterium HSG24]